MTSIDWCYAVQILREDCTFVRQVPVSMDWDPLAEWLRYLALRSGVPTSVALALECTVAPIWSSQTGAPFLDGVRGHIHGDSLGDLAADFAVGVFTAPARLAADALVTEGLLATGEAYRVLPVAYSRAEEGAAAGAKSRFSTRLVAPVLPIASGNVSSFMDRACGPVGGAGDEGDCRVFLPEEILDETRALAHAAEARETGGLLIGHLHRDADMQLFLEVTAQLPALHVDASQTRLTFTSDTWTEFRAALALRRRDEIMLGWWHSHPVREWCKNCSDAQQRVCSLRGDFLSEDDRLLHRAIFPRAYSMALVVNDVGYQDPTVSLFGWRQGLIALRNYHVLDPSTFVGTASGPALQESSTSTNQEEQDAHQ